LKEKQFYMNWEKFKLWTSEFDYNRLNYKGFLIGCWDEIELSLRRYLNDVIITLSKYENERKIDERSN